MKKALLVIAFVVGLGLLAAPQAKARVSFGISVGGPAFYPYAYGPVYGGFYGYPGYSGYYGGYPYYSASYYGRPYYRHYGYRYYRNGGPHRRYIRSRSRYHHR